MRRPVLLYVILFGLLTTADIGSTLIGTSSGNGAEFNPSVEGGGGGLLVTRMIAINAAMLVFTAAMLNWALSRRERIAPELLERPSRAMFSCYFYLNPFPRRNQPHTVLHYLALAPAILMLKAFATFNNGLISAGIQDIVTPLASLIMQVIEGTAAYWLLIIVLFQLPWYISLRLAASFTQTRTRPVPA